MTKHYRETENYFVDQVGRYNAFNVYSKRHGDYLCQLKRKEVDPWLARSERAIALDAETKVIQRQHRLEAARAYLAKRAVREAARGKQLTLF